MTEQAQCTAPLQYGNAVPARAGPGAARRGMQGYRDREPADARGRDRDARGGCGEGANYKGGAETHPEGARAGREKQAAAAESRGPEREAEGRRGRDGEWRRERPTARGRARTKRSLRPQARAHSRAGREAERPPSHRRRAQGCEPVGAGAERARLAGWGVWAAPSLHPWGQHWPCTCLEPDLQMEQCPQASAPGVQALLVGPRDLLVPRGLAPIGLPHQLALEGPQSQASLCQARPGPWCGPSAVALGLPSAWPRGLRLCQQIHSDHPSLRPWKELFPALGPPQWGRRLSSIPRARRRPQGVPQRLAGHEVGQ